jgi:tetraacyldisaccharide 4'-kinase
VKFKQIAQNLRQVTQMPFIDKLRTYYIDLVNDKNKAVSATIFCFFLLLSSFVYSFFVKLILFCYQMALLKPFKPACQVISVGNITWGGTGKTPFVETIVKFFKSRDKKIAILMRGYGEDEANMFREKFIDIPVLTGRNRIRTAKEAVEKHGVDIIILDDGFQHWRLGRDLDIVMIHSTVPFGNRKLVPRGILREPLSGLSRADVFVLTRSTSEDKDYEPLKQELRRYNSWAPIYIAEYQPQFLKDLNSKEVFALSVLKNQRIAVVCGIGNPRAFVHSLCLINAKIALQFYFSDHYRYTIRDLTNIKTQCQNNCIGTIVTTEKDAVKLIKFLPPQNLPVKILVLYTEFKIVEGEKDFFALLQENENKKKYYSILILSDGKAGHLNQAKAIARIIQKRKKDLKTQDSEIITTIVEVEFKHRLYRPLLDLCTLFGKTCYRSHLNYLRFCLKKTTFDKLMQTSANIVISAGSSLAAVNFFLANKNEAKSVVLMKPLFINLNRFDLVILPEHDQIKPKGNILVTKITPNLIDRQYLQEQANNLSNRLQVSSGRFQVNRLNIGVLIGGNTPKYRITSGLINEIILQLKKTVANLNCQLLITTSRRTPRVVERLLKENFVNFSECKLLTIANEKNIPEAVGGILGLSDIILVSGESISMVSEALSAEKYILVFKPEKKVNACTKQDIFLQKLESENMLRIIQPNNLFVEIEKACREKPAQTKIQDRELIYQAISRIL